MVLFSSRLKRRRDLDQSDASRRAAVASMCGMVCHVEALVGLTGIAMSATVTSKGQVTIPKPIRDRLGIKPGTKVAFVIDGEGRAFLKAEGRPALQPSRFERMRGTADARLSTDEIMALTRGERD
jgi:AbrB family looped-hinge helix DNA binding protein